MMDNVYSGTYRTDAAHDGAIPADFYSPALAARQHPSRHA